MPGIDIDISAFGLANDWFQSVRRQRPHRRNEVSDPSAKGAGHVMNMPQC